MSRSLPEALRPPRSRNVALLLESRIPARVGWVAPDGGPRVIAIWFVWDGEQLALSAFAGSRKLDELVAGTRVSVTIDTDTFPYRSLRLGGPISLDPVAGLAPEYRQAAARYLGEVAGSAWCESLDGRDQVVIRLRPTWASAHDMSSSPFLAET